MEPTMHPLLNKLIDLYPFRIPMPVLLWLFDHGYEPPCPPMPELCPEDEASARALLEEMRRRDIYKY